MRKTPIVPTGVEDWERGSPVKEGRQPLKTRQGTEVGFFLGSPEWNIALWKPEFLMQSDLCSIAGLQNY